TLFATFLPEEKVVDFISSVLAWYRKNAKGLGRIRLGDVIIRKGTGSLLRDLRGKFPQHVVEATIPPQMIDTQIGKRPSDVYG
ncbi:MAG: nitrite and sulphite reductase 4Fe-4S region, partial [uncultured bacterium]